MTLMLNGTGRYADAVWPGPRYNVAGDGMPPVWVAGIDERTASIVHVEWVANPATSPLVQGSSAPGPVRQAAVVDLLATFARYREVLEDENNPLRAVRIITNSPDAIPVLSWAHNEVGCIGVVEVRTTDG
ncbi:hypothetical protein ACNTMW_20215 [Planosporangium sp. 12N6]|uniref:hypothetical protein n=1 Tax=Planosporangium spinosum TaxID=3402278 RepID=UPI003CE838C9